MPAALKPDGLTKLNDYGRFEVSAFIVVSTTTVGSVSVNAAGVESAAVSEPVPVSLHATATEATIKKIKSFFITECLMCSAQDEKRMPWN